MSDTTSTTTSPPPVKPAHPGARNHELRIYMAGRKDRLNDDFYLAAPTIPVLVDLSRAAILFFPAEESDGDAFHGELVIKLQRDKEELEREREFKRTVRRTRRHTNGDTTK